MVRQPSFELYDCALTSGRGRQLLCCDLDSSVFLPGRILDVKFNLLVNSRDHLMQLELDLTDVLLRLEIVLLRAIIHVPCLQEESLRLFKEIINLDARDKVWVQVVVDALCATNLLLQRLISLLLELVEHDEGISL